MSFTESLDDIVAENRNQLLGKHSTWERVLLGNVATILNGFAFPSNKFSSIGPGTPIIRIRDILRDTTKTFFTGEVDPAYLVRKGDLLVGMDGDFNSSIWKGENALLNQRCCKITVDKRYFDKRFLAYCLPGYLSAINTYTSSVTVKHLSSRTIEEIPLPLPSIAEQKRIVAKIEELFSDLGAGVEALKKAKAQLKLYRHAVLKAAFEGRLTAEWREAHKGELEPATAFLQRIKAEKKQDGVIAREYPPVDTSNLPSLPKEWIWVRLGEITDGLQYGTSEKAGTDASGIPVIRMGNIQDGKIVFDDLKYFPSVWPDLKKFLLVDGDVLFNRTNSAELVGKTAVYKEHHPKAVFASYLIRVALNRSYYLPDILSMFINSTYGRKYIKSVVSQQVGQANVNGTKLAMMPIPLFSMSEQSVFLAEIEQRFSNIDEAEETLEQTFSKSNRLRQAILRQAFSGKLVPQDPGDEPAEELLERIRAEKAPGPRPSARRPRQRDLNYG
jgi:type I restriction enzyme S subunit